MTRSVSGYSPSPPPPKLWITSTVLAPAWITGSAAAARTATAPRREKGATRLSHLSLLAEVQPMLPLPGARARNGRALARPTGPGQPKKGLTPRPNRGNLRGSHKKIPPERGALMERVLRFFAFSAFSAVFSLVPSAASAQGDPQGPEFRVNTYTTNQQLFPSVAADSAGNFVVVWHELSPGQDGSDFGIFGQRYDSSGAPLGPEFRVNTYTPPVSTSGRRLGLRRQLRRRLDELRPGRLGYGVFGQRYASSGAPLGPEFRVNTYTTSSPDAFPPWPRTPPATSSSSGRATPRTARADGIFGQRYAASGAPLGPGVPRQHLHDELPGHPVRGLEPSGNFVVVWVSAPAGRRRPGHLRPALRRLRRPPRPRVPRQHLHHKPSEVRPSPWTPPATSSSSGSS